MAYQPQEESSWYDTAQMCRKGHVTTQFAKSQPNSKRKFCEECGAETITECLNCSATIKGYHHIPGVLHTTECQVPPFCTECGEPFPWNTDNERISSGTLAQPNIGLSKHGALLRYKEAFERQDQVLAKARPGSGNMSMVRPVKQEFDRINTECPGLIPPFQSADVSIEGLRLQIASALARISAEAQQHSSQRLVMGRKLFIGHGRSLVWLQLKDFLSTHLHLACDEFNEESPAGFATVARLEQMLVAARFAFLVMTAEDVHGDDTAHARENVIHEAGLFQGRLGFNRAIILLEQGCTEFSNIHGLTTIPFPKKNIEPAYEKIRRVLEREGILGTDSLPGA